MVTRSTSTGPIRSIPTRDDDGLNDGDEIALGTDPFDTDTDDDGLTDGDEVPHVYGTDPLDPDTDADGLNDGLEPQVGTNPLDPDTDNDGILDGSDTEFIQNAINGSRIRRSTHPASGGHCSPGCTRPRCGSRRARSTPRCAGSSSSVPTWTGAARRPTATTGSSTAPRKSRSGSSSTCW